MTTTPQERTTVEERASIRERAPRAVGRFARRGFLASLGAGGITAASAVFGKSQPAYAICNVNCCRLAVCPNISYSSCRSTAYYIWYCSVNAYLHCDCCESRSGGYQRSAAYCRYN